MNKDNAARYLPLMQALAEGKTIQLRHHEGSWRDCEEVYFTADPERYRIKPEPREFDLWVNDAGIVTAVNGIIVNGTKIRVREVID